MIIMAIDPGEKHNGVALFDGGELRYAEEVSPEVLYGRVRQVKVDLVVMESYKLYPWAAQEQGFSTMGTPEVIGVVKYLCGERGIRVVMQDAFIKKATFARCREKLAKVKNRHAKDAAAHGYYYLEHGYSRD